MSLLDAKYISLPFMEQYIMLLNWTNSLCNYSDYETSYLWFGIYELSSLWQSVNNSFQALVTTELD